MSTSYYLDTLNEKLRHDQRQAMLERENRQDRARQQLRDFAIQLREPGQQYAAAPASTQVPSFKLGDTPNFPYPAENRPERPGLGHMSPEAHKEFMTHLRNASESRDVRTRDFHTDKAARVVQRDWLSGKGLDNLKGDVARGMLHEMKAQVSFHARTLLQNMGLSPVGAAAGAYALERSLEREGFKVLASKAVDGISNAAHSAVNSGKEAVLRAATSAPDVYRPSVASASAATGIRHQMQHTLNSSMNWLAQHGVSREMFKNVLSRHSGKMQVVMEAASNPAVVQRVAQIVAQSPTALSAVTNMASDAELRKAVGTLAVASGQSMTLPGTRAAGSLAVVTGSVLRGDTTAETSRHIFRAAMSILGGAIGGMAGMVGGPLGMGALGLAGAEAGATLADKMLAYYDGVTGNKAPSNENNLVSKQEVKDSQKLLADRGVDFAKDRVSGASSRIGGADFERERVREFSPGRGAAYG